jgi:1-acyl-sn-glycerol-3-phosphate acyltransferase
LGHTLFSIMLKSFFHLRVAGGENLPRGKAIVAANHQSYIDPLAVGAAIPEEVSYLAREDVFKVAPFRWLCVKVNAILIRKRQADRWALKMALEKLADGKKVVVFPEGTRSYDGELQAPETGIGFLARYSGAPVVPTYVSGTFHALPRGGAMIRRQPVSVSFGPALRFEERSLRAGGRRAHEQFSQRVMEAIATLKRKFEESERSGREGRSKDRSR